MNFIQRGKGFGAQNLSEPRTRIVILEESFYGFAEASLEK
jgi:hypothetical protein